LAGVEADVVGVSSTTLAAGSAVFMLFGRDGVFCSSSSSFLSDRLLVVVVDRAVDEEVEAEERHREVGVTDRAVALLIGSVRVGAAAAGFLRVDTNLTAVEALGSPGFGGWGKAKGGLVVGLCFCVGVFTSLRCAFGAAK
jgi:hypothetical protein